MRCDSRLCAILWLLGFSFSPALASEEISLLPTTISLSTTEARQRLLVQRMEGDAFAGQVWDDVVLESSDPDIVRTEGGVAIPVANGTATITARVGDQTAVAEVTVTGQQAPFQWNFRNHVESVLSKMGCNGGACHGARAGKNGFRLTLFGFDLDADYEYLTRHARGRRIVPSDPGRSLILTKPTGAVPHKGGVRFETDSLEYRVLAEWIAGGTPSHRDDDPIIERLEVLPPHSQQTVGVRQQLVVLAHFSDGHVEDVTHWAKYTAVNQSVAQVDEQGLVEVMGAGEGAVKVWYLNINALAYLSVPYENDVPAQTFAKAPRRNFIDEIVLEKLQSLNLPPSPPCDDATFLRRAYLDTIGVLPTEAEVKEFLADESPDRRDRLIEELLARPEFVDYWSYKWSDLLLVSGQRLRPEALKAYYGWIREQVADNTPWDGLVRDLVTARGGTFENGAANFYALHQEPTQMAETVSQAFLGLAINCAKCHNHPLEKWTNDQYYGFANLFSRVRAKGWGGDFRGGDGNRVVFTDVRGELLQPSTGRPQPPRPLDAEPLPFDGTTDRRVYLAEWLTSPENPYFTRSIVNRVWANFFGVGLVENVDDMRATNPASNEELLAAASDYLIEQNYDLKELMRAILQSAAYQRSSEPTPGNGPDERFYSRYYPRRLPAEVMLDAMSQATGVPAEFPNYPKGTRALELPDVDVASYFLNTFGRPERLITCECERTAEPSMTQVLHLYNGDTLMNKLQSPDGRIARQIAAGATDEEIIDTAYLACLSRLPTPSERQQLRDVFAAAPADERRLVVEDLYWSLLSSKEFLFNH
ncbi:MAG: DUF1553 domain-containing protein [Planctomycetes bacterium]|nr:DUF1553 domain-containing protein [Planctomycetota bacterium]